MERNSPLLEIKKLSSEQAKFVSEIFKSFHRYPDLFDARVWNIFSDYDGLGTFSYVVDAHENLTHEARKASIYRGLTIDNAYSNSLACMVLATYPYTEFKEIAKRLAASDNEEIRWTAELAVER